jgi:2-phospho-L-lactate/phosphoenolpyruvate guanylyltransferase
LKIKGDIFMSVWAIIPVKPLRRAKSRLAGVLSDIERCELNKKMLENVLQAVTGVNTLADVVVVSRDPDSSSIAKRHNVRILKEEHSFDLNIEISRSIFVAQTYGAHAVLILPADLPLVKTADIQYFLERDSNPPEMRLALDYRGISTNALYLNPVGLTDIFLGANSTSNHINKAKESNISLDICTIPACLWT